MGRADIQFVVGAGIALMSLAPGLSDGLRLALAVVGGAMVFVSAVVVLARFFQRHWPSEPSPAPEVRAAARWPDFRVWDEHEEFELYQAACLWFDREPILPMPDNARSLFAEWQAAIEGGNMNARFTYDPLSDAVTMAMLKHPMPGQGTDFAPLVTVHTRVSRRVLKAWADDRGQQPRFLFPERRSD
jgi:hypothetical protein